MNVILALNTLTLALVISAGVVFVVALCVLFYFLLIRKKRLRHQIHNLSRRYEYLHSLLIGQDTEYLSHIEEIAEVNLLYSPIYDQHLSRLNHLKDNQDVFVGEKLDDITEDFENKHYKQTSQAISEFKPIMLEFENEVNKLNSDLIQIIQPEKDCYHLLYEAQEHFNQIKQEYMLRINELTLLKKSYEEVFKYVETLFNDFTTLVEEANYEEANRLMPSIHKILDELDNVNSVMPSLCALANHEVPQRITDVESEYKRMDNESYPIYHIVTPKQITAMREEAHAIVRNLKNFVYKNANEQLENILNRVKNYLTMFQKEKDDRKAFELEEAPTYARVTKIEKDFIKLCNSIPKIQKIYAINDEKIMMRNTIQNHINRIGVSKRSLETFVHTIGKRQPYSALLKRTLELKKEAEQIEIELSEFKDYLTSLKVDVEKAYELVSAFYYRLRHAEKILRDLAIPSISEKYQSKIDSIYQHLEKINTTALAMPIQVQEINEAVNFINFDGESILNQIEQEQNMSKLAESSIIYINKDRGKYPDLNNVVKQNEKIFIDGEFEKTYTNVTGLIKRYSQMEE